MTGEMYQVCNIVASAKNALKSDSGIFFEPVKYEKSIVFQFSGKKPAGKKQSQADSVKEWFEKCRKRGLEDIKFLTPIDVKERHLLAFVNVRQNLLTCFFNNGDVTCFNAYWEFNKEKEGWDITYIENLWDNPPKEKPRFHDNTESFINVLNQIKIFARTIECNDFADTFHKAALAATGVYTEKTEMGIKLPEKNMNIFRAASIADVFGGMGSWNDSPPYMAHEMNLDKQYEDLSGELHKQLTLAVLYAVNEW
jgi:hypothetical protein